MTVGVARACAPFLLGFDVLEPVSEAMLDQAVSRNFRWVGRYVNNLTGVEVAAIFGRGLGILPYTEAMTSEPLSGSTGDRYGRSIAGTAAALGMPPRVDVAIDLEAPAPGSECADHVNEMAGALIGAGFDAALYVGSPQPLDAAGLYARAPAVIVPAVVAALTKSRPADPPL